MSNPLHFSLIILLLLVTPFLSLSSEDVPSSDDDDLSEIDELLAVDEQEERDSLQKDISSEAKVLSKAQRIVVELNNDNTQKTIEQNGFVLLLGYTPWCPRSAELMPQFAEAANLLNELGSPLLLAKIDAERYPKTASALDIKGYPTLLLFTNGTSQPYTGGFTAAEIVIWARKKIGDPVVRLNSVIEAEAFAKKYSMFVLGLFEKFEGHQYEEFFKAATLDNEIQFFETDSDEVAKSLFSDIKATKPFIGLVKSEPERYTSFEEALETDKILQFLDLNKFPLVITLTELNSAKVYSSARTLQVYIFAKSDEVKSLLQPLQEVAKKFKSKIMFIYVEITQENLAKPFLTLLGLEDSQKIVVAAFDSKISTKYLLETEPTLGAIEEFCAGLLHGTVPMYFKSQPIPNNENASIQIVVGKTFDYLVLGSPKNVFLEVYTPWCMSCDATSKQVEKLAKHFKGLENLIFAKIDAAANEHPRLEVTDYPSLLFYPAADKSNPIKLSAKSSLKDLGAFIKKNVKPEDNVAKKDEL
ncbi:protein disulfide isomerase-like 1-6 [Amaranthus tricolor]|uniref:protein disulfide isomerase-like 1-6 n=1 Tax=Amaranthus tricolor TaxID=29722 RepID=UPI00258ED217|nr:protein disulfide isomerase-like 1-6 [Amaranthus tricolor]